MLCCNFVHFIMDILYTEKQHSEIPRHIEFSLLQQNYNVCNTPVKVNPWARHMTGILYIYYTVDSGQHQPFVIPTNGRDGIVGILPSKPILHQKYLGQPGRPVKASN